ncbi:uncharacterized protein LOC144018874 [Festucalex cinctus]
MSGICSCLMLISSRMATAKGDRASKFEALKLLEKCQKERDDAVHREGVLRDKLRQYESRLRSTEALKQKLKTLLVDNKELRKQVKSLRTEIGLECSPKFHGKTTKDVINDLHEKERECDTLIEKVAKLGLTVDELTFELANTVTSKTLLEEQVQSLQQNLKDMTSNQRRLLKLWEDKKVQREQQALSAIAFKPGQKPSFTQKAIQTDMTISPFQNLPVNVFEAKTGGAKTPLDRSSFTTYHEDKSFMCGESKGLYN